METKICRKCGISKTVDDFEKNGKYKYKDGTERIEYKSDCKECRKGCRKDYYDQNREQFNQKHREYYEQNKNDINEKRKENVECECGCVTKKHYLSRHLKTLVTLNTILIF